MMKELRKPFALSIQRLASGQVHYLLHSDHWGLTGSSEAEVNSRWLRLDVRLL